MPEPSGLRQRLEALYVQARTELPWHTSAGRYEAIAEELLRELDEAKRRIAEMETPEPSLGRALRAWARTPQQEIALIAGIILFVACAVSWMDPDDDTQGMQ